MLFHLASKSSEWQRPHPLEECPIYLGYSQGIQRYGDDEYFWRREGGGFPVRYFSNPFREKGKLAGTVVVFQDITERKRNEAEIARLFKEAENWAEELTRLHEASSYLTATFDLDQVYAEIARQSAWLLRCPKACVFNLDGQNTQFKFAASFGLNPSEKQTLLDQLPGENWLTGLAKRGKTTAIQNTSLDGGFPEALRNELDIQAALFVPIWSSEHPQAFILLMDGRIARPWNAREVELIEGLANRAAVALMDANLHQQLELAAALEERQRIAANMHDGLAQTLSLLGLRVDRMQELFRDGFDPEIEAVTHEIRTVVTQASTEVRRSIASLQATPKPRSSLQNLLQELVEQLEPSGGPKLSFDPDVGGEIWIPTEQSEQILPLVQEAILNASHHAQAQTVAIRLEKTGEKLRITIEDDGCGFDPNAPTNYGDHFGLSIMQARAARIGGEFRIYSSPGKGTRILLAWKPEPDRISKSDTSF